MKMSDDIQKAKKAAGEKAVDFIEAGMTVGLGTGSTAYWAIQEIGRRVSEGLQVRAIATSRESEDMARQLGIPLATFSEIEQIDIDIDGADEADGRLQLIKGGGGALLREKIIASISRQFVVVIDEHKFVERLGRFPLPVEVIPFGWETVFRKISVLQGTPVLRQKNGETYLTDNGNYILDCAFGNIQDPAALQQTLHHIPGIVEDGLFLKMATKAVIGYADGQVKIIG